MNTRERLIEGARELLWERGYVGMSPKAIQRKAEAGQGSMYHHFSGKTELAEVALRRSAETLRGQTEKQLSAGGSALERIAAYLLRDRDVLRGCPIGRLAQDPEVIADPRLRRPLNETFSWLRDRLAEIVRQGVAQGEFSPELDAADTAAAMVAVLQGGYVLARASGSAEPFASAVRGAVALLSAEATKSTTPGQRS